MNITELITLIVASYKAKRPVLALSSPGVGKSSACHKAAVVLAEAYGESFGLIEIRGSSSNPAELADIKFIVDGEVRDALQGWVPTEEKVACGEVPARGFVLVEEAGDASLTVQSALQQLLLDRRLGSAKLADGWHTVAASNRAADKAAAGRLSTALINRCITVDVKPDTKIFGDWAIDKGLSPTVIGYARWRGNAIWNFDPRTKAENPAFCSPRSLHILSDMLEAMPQPSLELITACVGDGIGSEIYGFSKLMNELPDLDAVCEGRNVPAPTATDVSIATIYALIGRFNEKTAQHIIAFLSKFEGELAIMGMTDLIRKDVTLVVKQPAYLPWAVNPVIQKLLLGC